MLFPKIKPWRSEKHRRLISSLNCVVCGHHAPSQCAHVNFNKALSSKADDSLTFPACPACHQQHDQGGIHTKTERHQREWEYVDATRALLIQRNLWSPEAETAYKVAIQPLARVVHADMETA